MDASLFPYGIEKYLIFCVIATLFFLLQFIRTKYWYELILTIAVPASLLVYVNQESDVWFYGVGIMEAVMLVAAAVTYFIQYRKVKAAEKLAQKNKTEMPA